MPRVHSPSAARIALVVTLVGAALAACHDAPTASERAASFVPPALVIDREAFAFAGDTIDLRQSVLLADDGDVTTCDSGDPSLATPIHGSAIVVAGNAEGDVALTCVQQRRAYVPSSPENAPKFTVATYRIHLHVATREIAPPMDGPLGQPVDRARRR